MFAYCGNNPINYLDATGEFPWLVVVAIAIAIVAIGIDHSIAANCPDGEFQLVEDTNGDQLEEKILYGTGNGVTYDGETFTLLDSELGLYDGIARYENGELSLTNLMTANATLSTDFHSKLNV